RKSRGESEVVVRCEGRWGLDADPLRPGRGFANVHRTHIENASGARGLIREEREPLVDALIGDGCRGRETVDGSLCGGSNLPVLGHSDRVAVAIGEVEVVSNNMNGARLCERGIL